MISHCGALGRALGEGEDTAVAALREQFGHIAVRTILPGYRFKQEFFSVDGDIIELKFGAAEKLAELMDTAGQIRRGDPNTYGLSFGFHTAIMLRQEYWRSYTTVPAVAGKNYISGAAFREMALEENKYALAFARALKELEVSAFLIVAPPIRQAMIDRQVGLTSKEELLAVHQRYTEVMSGDIREHRDALHYATRKLHGEWRIEAGI